MKFKQTRLDRSLSRLSESYGKVLRNVLIVLFIVEAIEQLVMHFNLNQMFAVFLSASAVGVLIIESVVRKQIEKKEKEEE